MLVKVWIRYFDKNDGKELMEEFWVDSGTLPPCPPHPSEDPEVYKQNIPVHRKDAAMMNYRLVWLAVGAFNIEPGILVADGICRRG